MYGLVGWLARELDHWNCFTADTVEEERCLLACLLTDYVTWVDKLTQYLRGKGVR